MGTDFPLVTAMILASGMDPVKAFIFFGIFQIISGLYYGIPMPVQPLKAVAALVIAQQLDVGLISGAALSIGLVMLALTMSGAIDWIARWIPKAVIRGIQLGLGIKLAFLALTNYMPSEGLSGIFLVLASFLLIFFLMNSRRFPASLAVLLLGGIFALVRGLEGPGFENQVVTGAAATAGGFFALPSWDAVCTGFLLLALPQIPLSMGNSMFATRQMATDWFPERKVSLRQIGTSYSLFNIVIAFFGGIPVCHGSGGMAGHYAFGARTGASVVIYGVFYILLGVGCSLGFTDLIYLFPLPMLGVLLFFEAATLIRLMRDLRNEQSDMILALVVGLAAITLPKGFLTAMLLGAGIAALLPWLKRLRGLSMENVES